MTTPIHVHAADMTGAGHITEKSPIETAWEVVRLTGNNVVRACARAKTHKAVLRAKRTDNIDRGAELDACYESRVHFALLDVRMQLKLHRQAWKTYRLVDDLTVIARTARVEI